MSFHDLQLHHGPVGVLPMMQEARVGVWQSGGMPPVVSDDERLKRRLETYRQRHEANRRKYDDWTSSVANHQRQQTALLFQRWVESRCRGTTVSKSKFTKGDTITADTNTRSTVAVSSNGNSCHRITYCGWIGVE